MKDMTPVGTVELVALPDAELYDVPAKIDTGADSSAIWATEITEHEDQLSFILLGKSSSKYNGKMLTTKNYKVISVKNSFGQRELRYKVKLKLVLADRSIQASFTLANREQNKYPILIGRRTLHGKFLVDVSRRKASTTYNVLLLSTKRTALTNSFATKLTSKSKRLEVTSAAYDELRFKTGGKANRIELATTAQDLAEFDLIYFKNRTEAADISAAIARYAEERNIPYLDTVAKYYPNTSKLYEYVVMTNRGFSVPETIFMLSPQLEKSYTYLVEELGLPFVLKDAHGKQGAFNYLIRNNTDFRKASREAADNEVKLISQSFIPNDGDYRVLIYGNKIVMAIHRLRPDDTTHLNNTSQGGAATLVSAATLPPAIQTACISAAQCLERQIAGVDIIQDKLTGVWYFLEVNAGPQLATGAFTDEKQDALVAYIERKLSK